MLSNYVHSDCSSLVGPLLASSVDLRCFHIPRCWFSRSCASCGPYGSETEPEHHGVLTTSLCRGKESTPRRSGIARCHAFWVDLVRVWLHLRHPTHHLSRCYLVTSVDPWCPNVYIQKPFFSGGAICGSLRAYCRQTCGTCILCK